MNAACPLAHFFPVRHRIRLTLSLLVCSQLLWFYRCVVVVVYECQATPAVYVSIVSNLSHVGDNITVQCRIAGVPDIRPRVKWVKSAVGDSGKLIEQTIADGVHVVEPYASLGRYYPDLAPLSQVTLYLITIYCKYFCISATILGAFYADIRVLQFLLCETPFPPLSCRLLVLSESGAKIVKIIYFNHFRVTVLFLDLMNYATTNQENNIWHK